MSEKLTLVEQLRAPVSMSMFARKEDMLHTLFQERRESAELIEELLDALKTLFESYKQLADSGDAGFWALEDLDEGKQAMAAILKAEGR